MKRHPFLLSLLFLGSVLVQSCLPEDKEAIADTALGEATELSVLTDANSWREFGSLIDSVFASPMSGMVEEEPWLLLRKADESKFEGIFRKHYNVLILIHGENWATLRPFIPEATAKRISDILTSDEVKVLRDSNRWARPQQIHYIISPRMHQMAETLRQKSQAYLQLVLDAERRSTRSSLLHNVKADYDTFFQNRLQERGYAVRRSGDFRLSVQDTMFLGLSRYVADKFQGLYLHHEAYVSQNQFSGSYIIDRRNLVMASHVQGAVRPDSVPTYMSTDTLSVKPVRRVFNLNGRYVVETRGWWEMANEFKAGPFVSYTIHCPDLGKVVTLEGILFAPGREKAKLLRQLELLMSTFETRI